MKLQTLSKTVVASVAALFISSVIAARVDVYPQSFDAGGWALDAQFMDVMGSPYLLAHGLGVRVTDAKSRVSFQTRDEKIVGTFDLPASKDWKEVKLPFETPLTGVQNIKLIVDEGKDLDIDWISFE